MNHPTTLLAPISSSPWNPRHKLADMSPLDNKVYSRGDALPQPRYVHDGVQWPTTRGAGRDQNQAWSSPPEPAQRSASQPASGFSCSRGVIVVGSEDGRGVAFEFTLAPLPQRPRLPRYYLVGAVATNPTPTFLPTAWEKGHEDPDLQVWKRECRGLLRRVIPCRTRALSGCGVVCVRAATAAMRHRQPDGDSRHVPCLLDSGVGLR